MRTSPELSRHRRTERFLRFLGRVPVDQLDGTPRKSGKHASESSYKLKCPKKDVALPTVVDQFGERAMGKFKASLLCGPAVVN